MNSAVQKNDFKAELTKFLADFSQSVL